MSYELEVASGLSYVRGFIRYSPEYNKDEMKRSVFIGGQKVSDIYSFNQIVDGYNQLIN